MRTTSQPRRGRNSARPPKNEKLAWRLTQTLSRLHQGDAIDKHQLAREFAVNVRTIERDLNERLRGIVERDAQGSWQLTHSARGTIPAQRLNDYARLTGTGQLFPDTSLVYLLERLEQPAKPHPLHVQPTATEDLRARTTIFKQLETAVLQRFYCGFDYKSKARKVEPYRLIHKNGVWYLAATEAGRLKNFSIALIESLQVDTTRRFIPSEKYQEYIGTTDDIWFTEVTTEALLRVQPEVAHYFTRRALLPEQQQREDRDGSLLVTARINHINQLLPVVRYWLPHVRIVRPVAWQEELVASLRQALKQLGESDLQHTESKQ